MRQSSTRAAVLTATSIALAAAGAYAADMTYAERLGWKADDRVVIIHVDDAAMSHDSNMGALRSVREGVASSISVMMSCPWVPEFVTELKKTPAIDAGATCSAAACSAPA